MRRKLGRLCMLLGAVLLVGALSLKVYNRMAEQRAQEAVVNVLPQLIAQVPEEPDQDALDQRIIPPEFLDAQEAEMTEVILDGYAYIGYLTMPKLSLSLPIMADWDYDRLQISPCRYTGSLLTDNLVLMAHNFEKHFGRLSELNPGDEVFFTDMDGITTAYTVVLRDVLVPTAVAEMTCGDFDLALFTCTYGGKSRVAVYCDRKAME